MIKPGICQEVWPIWYSVLLAVALHLALLLVHRYPRPQLVGRVTNHRL
jgi:hypothetical protein